MSSPAIATIAALALCACSGETAGARDPSSGGSGDGSTSVSGSAATGSSGSGAAGGGGDVYKKVFDAVDKENLKKLLDELTGATPVTVNGETFGITERWSPEAKANFRAYWTQYFTALGATVNELAFPIDPDDVDSDHAVDEPEGHNLEAILPGKSPDSVVIIVHYDTVGLVGQEKNNPGADDDGSGLATQMEAARIFSTYENRSNTVRFVAADYEEISDDLAGDVAYVAYLQQEAAAKGFEILVAADNDQTAWSCWNEGLCDANPPPPNSIFRMTSCSGDALNYNYPELLQGFTDVAKTYATIQVQPLCDGSGDTDHYPFWEAGIPAYVIEEFEADNNPHYDDVDTGDDTLAHIDIDYLFQISEVAITYQAKLVGLGDR